MMGRMGGVSIFVLFIEVLFCVCVLVCGVVFMLVWCNSFGGFIFCIDDGCYIKWGLYDVEVNMCDEVECMCWVWWWLLVFDVFE